MSLVRSITGSPSTPASMKFGQEVPDYTLHPAMSSTFEIDLPNWITSSEMPKICQNTQKIPNFGLGHFCTARTPRDIVTAPQNTDGID